MPRRSSVLTRLPRLDLVKAGLDVDGCRAYLTMNAPALVLMFDDLVAKAAAEQ